jgi:purine-binding chemotaxis protein CheW
MADTRPATDIEGVAASRFLTFRIDNYRYAVPADQVSEVVRVPPFARVPLAPASLLGLANLRGSVLPLVSLRRLLGRGEGHDGAAVRAIVLDGGLSVALVVDRVEALVTIAPERIETRQAAVAARENERLEGAFADGSEDEPTRILDVRALVEAAFVRRNRAPSPARANSASAAQATWIEDADEHPGLVAFQVAVRPLLSLSRQCERSSPRPNPSRPSPTATRRSWA